MTVFTSTLNHLNSSQFRFSTVQKDVINSATVNQSAETDWYDRTICNIVGHAQP